MVHLHSVSFCIQQAASSASWFPSLCLSDHRDYSAHADLPEGRRAGEVSMVSDSPISLEALAMRPDVKSAEYTLRASFYNTRAARSQFYPSLQLNASGSWTNYIGEIINPG